MHLINFICKLKKEKIVRSISAAWCFCMSVNAGLVTDIRYPHGFCRRLSNGETESAKTMLVEDSESDQATTPSKDGTLVIRQVGDGHLSY